MTFSDSVLSISNGGTGIDLPNCVTWAQAFHDVGIAFAFAAAFVIFCRLVLKLP